MASSSAKCLVLVLSKIMKNPQLSIKGPDSTKFTSKPTNEKSKVSIMETEISTANEIQADAPRICSSKTLDKQPTERRVSTAMETTISTAMETTISTAMETSITTAMDTSITTAMEIENSSAKTLTNELSVAKELTSETTVVKELSGKETSNEVVELLFTVKTEPNDEIENNTFSQISSDACEPSMVFLNNALDDLASSSSELKINNDSTISDSIHHMNKDVLKLQETIDIKQSELEWAKGRIKYLEEQLKKVSADPKLVKEAAKSMAVKALNEAITKITEDEEDKPTMITSAKSENEIPKDSKMIQNVKKHTRPIIRTRVVCPKYHQLITKRKATSSVWQFYGLPADENGKILSSDISVCKLCNHPVSLKYGNTTNIRSHLRVYHPSQFKNLL